MTLEEYKKKYHKRNIDLARLFGVSQTTIHHWLSGYSSPSLNNAFTVFIKTKGQVTPTDLGIIC